MPAFVRLLLVVVSVLLAADAAYAQNDAASTPADARVAPFPRFSDLDLDTDLRAVPFTWVLVDSGSQLGVYPSLQQSLGLYEAFAVGQNELLRRTFAATHNPWLQWLVGIPTTVLVSAFTDFTASLPFGAPHQAWLHEEWHRAVMSSASIDTFDSYAVPSGQLAAALQGRFSERSLGSVLGASDDALARFKRTRPGDYVRMSTAGIEAQGEAVRQIERDQFFFFGEDRWVGPLVGVRGWNAATLWTNVVNNIGYVALCSTGASQDETEAYEALEPDPLMRDFTGLDCDAAVYDMFRPREPYAARGVHPSGVGVDRYRHTGDLTQQERAFTELQARLMLLTLVDPALFNISGLRFDDVIGGRDLKVTARLNTVLAPIGSVAEFETLAQMHPFNVALALRAQVTPRTVLPAVDVALIRMPFVLRLPAAAAPEEGVLGWASDVTRAVVDPTVFTLSVNAQAWLQPHALIVTDDDVRAGGLTRFDVGVMPIPNLEVVLSGMIKSEGFAPGVLQTGPGAGAGLALRTWIY